MLVQDLIRFFSISIFQAMVSAWESLVLVLTNGGWLAVTFLLVAIIFWRRYLKKHDEFAAKIDWVFLDIAVPELPSPSILAADLMFSQIHATKKNYDWRETYILGKFRSWFSFEIVSLGGMVRYIVRTPREFSEAVRSAIFSQYPDAEISEVGDYMDAFATPFNPDQVDYDLWGTEIQLEKSDVYPIKTYPLFEHRAAETIIDPLAGLLEDMTDIGPEEVIAIQLIAQPSDDDWKEEAQAEALKLKGWEGVGSEDKPISLMQHLSDAEKNVITSIQGKAGKLSYLCKIRFLYAAPKDKMKKELRVPMVLGSFAQFSAFDLNSFKVNKYSATKVDVKISEKYEAKRVEHKVLWKKRSLIKNYKLRHLYKGGKRFHMSTEELASIYHFPLESVHKAAIEKIEARKAEPPVNLPV